MDARFVIAAACACFGVACGPATGGGEPRAIDDDAGPIVAYPDDAGASEGGPVFPSDDAGAEADPDAPTPVDDDTGGAAMASETDPPPPPCTTTIEYGPRWIHPPGHDAQLDVVTGSVSWDGSCATAGSNSMATLSNGWAPYFAGTFDCTIAIDDGCAPPPSCGTRITYASKWIHPSGHPAQYDDVGDRVTWDGVCHVAGSNSYAVLSNGWAPYFTGTTTCAMAFAYVGCGGL